MSEDCAALLESIATALEYDNYRAALVTVRELEACLEAHVEPTAVPDGGTLVADGDGEQTVWIAGRRLGGRSTADQRIHTDPDCPGLASARSVFEKPLEHVSDRELCTVCAGEFEPHDGGNEGAWKDLEALDPEDLGLSGPGERPGQEGGESDE